MQGCVGEAMHASSSEAGEAGLVVRLQNFIGSACIYVQVT
jgi:hypothetical protein